MLLCKLLKCLLGEATLRLVSPMQSKNILILNGDLPVFPGWGGHEYLNTTNLRKLTSLVGLVSNVNTAEQKAKVNRLSEAGISLYLWENQHLTSAPIMLAPTEESELFQRLRWLGGTAFALLQRRLSRPNDTIVRDFQFANLAPHILKAIREHHWDALVVIQSSAARWLDLLPSFPVTALVLHDVRALVYLRQILSAKGLFTRFKYLLEAARFWNLERRYCRKYDLIITVSKDDEAWVKKHYKPANTATVPIPVDRKYFAPPLNVAEVPNRIVFTGHMSHPPNVDAACYFARDVFPLIRQQIKNAEFWIVGREPAPEVCALAELPGVTVTGLVPDIREYMAKAAVIVVPLRFGSGVRNKILEAWAMEKCVVSTTIGAEGLDYHDGENLIIADDAAGLAQKTIRILSNPSLKEYVRHQGLAVVEKEHDPMRVAQIYLNALTEVAIKKKGIKKKKEILIDLRWFYSGINRGLESIVIAFLDTLFELDQQHRYVLLVPSSVRYDFTGYKKSGRVRLILDDGPRRDLKRLVRGIKCFCRNLLHVGDWRALDVDRLQKCREQQTAVALSLTGYIDRDLCSDSHILLMPEIPADLVKVSALNFGDGSRRRAFTESFHMARHIIAFSSTVRDALIKQFAVNAEKISVVYPAADPIFQPGYPARKDTKEVLAKYQLNHAYFLVPGNVGPKKNHAAVVDGLKKLTDLSPLLVFVGGLDPASEVEQKALADAIAAANLGDQIRFLGQCSPDDLPALYEGALAMVYPAVTGEFALPLIEAMTCGCPVISNRLEITEELAGDAALFIEANLAGEYALAFRRIITERNFRQQLVERGLQQAEIFSRMEFTAQMLQLMIAGLEE